MERNKKKEPELKASDIQTVENLTKKKKRFIIEKLSDLFVHHTIANTYLTEAIALSTSLRSINFENNVYTSKHWKFICEGILKNNSIESLIFNRTLDMDDSVLEMIGQIFTLKKIRSVHFEQIIAKPGVMEKLSPYIADCKTLECLSIIAVEHGALDYLLGVTLNKSLKKFKIRQSLNADQLKVFSRYINKSNITTLHLSITMTKPDLNLSSIISAPNCVQKLTLNNNIRTVNEVRYLTNSLKDNTKLESLKLICDKYSPEDPIDFAQQLGSLLTQTKTLKRISFVDRSMTQYAINGIAMNTSLTALDVAVMTAELYDDLCGAILSHPSLEKVKIRSVQPPNHLTSLNLIDNSKTLTDIDISDSENLDDGILKLICESMTRRQKISRIRVTLDTTSLAQNHEFFWQALTDCTSLNCFEIDYSCSKPFSSAIWSKVESVLERNTGITSIGKFNDAPDNVKRKLDDNWKRVHYGVSYTKMLVSMMARRNEAFTEKLPLELWAMILRRLRYHGVGINFEELLLNSVNKS